MKLNYFSHFGSEKKCLVDSGGVNSEAKTSTFAGFYNIRGRLTDTSSGNTTRQPRVATPTRGEEKLLNETTNFKLIFPNNNQINFFAFKNMKIINIKYIISIKFNLKMNELRFIFNGKLMSDARSIEHYFSNQNQKIYLIFQLQGGSGNLKKTELQEKNKELTEEITKLKLDVKENMKLIEELKKFISEKKEEPEITQKSTSSFKETSKAKGFIKPVKLKGIQPFDGNEEFKDWIKIFNMQMMIYDDDTKLVTLVSYLSQELILLLSNVEMKHSADFNTLCKFLSSEFKKSEKSVRETLDEVSRIQQKESEAVLTYYARMNAKLVDIKFHIPLNERKELFISGLKTELQTLVRLKVNTDDTLEKALEIAKIQEIELQKT